MKLDRREILKSMALGLGSAIGGGFIPNIAQASVSG